MMAGGIYEQLDWPDNRSDYVEVCDGCHTAIWSTRWNEETSDGFDAFLARNGWHDYIDQLDPRTLNLCPECALRALQGVRSGRLPIGGSAPCAPTRTPTGRSTPSCPPANVWWRACC